MAIFGQISGFDPIQALEAGPAHESRADGAHRRARSTRARPTGSRLTVQALEAREPGRRAHRRARPSSCRGPGSRAGPDVGLMATSWTGPTFEGRGQSRAGAGLTVQGSRAHRPGPRSWTGSRLTVGLMATSWTGPTFELSRAGLTAKLDGSKHEGRGQSRAGLDRPGPSKLDGRSTRAGPTALERSRAGLTGSPSGRSRAGLTGSPSGSPSRAGLTAKLDRPEAREHGPRAHGSPSRKGPIWWPARAERLTRAGRGPLDGHFRPDIGLRPYTGP